MNDFQKDLSERLNQLYSNEGESASIDSEGENRRLFELAVRVYCQRLGTDLYSAYFEGSLKENIKNKYEQEEREKWILDLCNSMLFSFDPPTDDFSQVDDSKFDWMVHVGSAGTEQEGIPYFSYLSRDSDTRLWQWQHPYEAFHRSILRESLQRYEQARQQTFMQARMLLGSREGTSFSDEENDSTVTNKLNRVETIFAQVLGVNIEEENASVLIDLAGELLHILPSDWELGTVESEVGMLIPFFYDSLRGVSQWHHPFESQHRQMIVARRNDLTRQKKESRIRAQNAREMSAFIRERARQADELVRAELSTHSSIPTRTSSSSSPRKPIIAAQSLEEGMDEDEELEHKSESHLLRSDEMLQENLHQSAEPKVPADTMATVPDESKGVVNIEKVSQPVATIVAQEVEISEDATRPINPKEEDVMISSKSEDKTPVLTKAAEEKFVVTKTEDNVIMSPSKAQEVPMLWSEETSVALSLPRADDAMIHLEGDEMGRLDLDDDMTSHYTEVGDERSVFSHSETTLVPGADLPQENSLFDASEVQPMQPELPCPEESVYSDDFSTLSKLDIASTHDSQAAKLTDEEEGSSVVLKTAPVNEEESYTEDFSVEDTTTRVAEVKSPLISTESATLQVKEPEPELKTTSDGEDYAEDFSSVESQSDLIHAEEMRSVPIEPISSLVPLTITVNDEPDTLTVGASDIDIGTKEEVASPISGIEKAITAEDLDVTTAYDEDFSAEEDSISAPSISLERLALQLKDDRDDRDQKTQEDHIVSALADELVLKEDVLPESRILDEPTCQVETVVNQKQEEDRGDDEFEKLPSDLREDISDNMAIGNEAEAMANTSITPDILPVATEANEEDEKSYTSDFSSVTDIKVREVTTTDEDVKITPVPLEEKAVTVTSPQQSAPPVKEVKFLTVMLENFHAHDLKDTGSFLNKQDPALSLQIGSQNFHTMRVKDAGTNARFPETFSFVMEKTEFDENIELEVEVFNESVNGGKTHIGKGKGVLREWVKNFGTIEHVTVQLFHKGKTGEAAKGKLSFQYVIAPQEVHETPENVEMTEVSTALIQDTKSVADSTALDNVTTEGMPDENANDLKLSAQEAEVARDSVAENEVSPIKINVSVTEEDYMSDFSLDADSQTISKSDPIIDEPVLLSEENVVRNDFIDEDEKQASPAPSAVDQDRATLLQQLLEDEHSLALSIESHPFWEPTLPYEEVHFATQTPIERLTTDIVPAVSEPEPPRTVRSLDLVAQREVSDNVGKDSDKDIPKTELLEAEELEIIPKISFPDVPMTKETMSMDAEVVRVANIASRPIKLSAKHLFVLQNSRQAEYSASSPDLKSLPLAESPSPNNRKKKNAGDVQPKWFHLGAYETNAEALRSRKIIKNIVINDSNGTIQIYPVVNFYEIFNSHGAGSKNNGGDEDNALLIIGRMNTDANKGAVKIIIRKNMSKMQWVVETDDAEVERIVQRHRRKRGLDGLNDDPIPVKPLKRVAATSAAASIKAIRQEVIGEQQDGGVGIVMAESKGFGALLSQKMLVEAAQKSRVRHNKYSDVVRENISKYSCSSEKQYGQQRDRDEAPVCVRPKVDELDCQLQKLKHLLLGSATVPSSMKGRAVGGGGLRSVKLPPIN